MKNSAAVISFAKELLPGHLRVVHHQLFAWITRLF